MKNKMDRPVNFDYNSRHENRSAAPLGDVSLHGSGTTDSRSAGSGIAAKGHCAGTTRDALGGQQSLTTGSPQVGTNQHGRSARLGASERAGRMGTARTASAKGSQEARAKANQDETS